jgi:hypothetical protein
MKQEELFQTKSPSMQPLFCAISYSPAPFIERRSFETGSLNGISGLATTAALTTTVERTSTVVRTNTAEKCANGHKTITDEAIADFLSLSRRYLELNPGD